MKHLTIEKFWKPRLRISRPEKTTLIPGWSIQDNGHDTFLEAPLLANEELSQGIDLHECQILLVSAPGAVGKSTLAREICYETGAIYIDLSKAGPVGENTLTGGLVKSGLYGLWQANSITVLIDALDEARIRVTDEAFEAFLKDVAELSKNRSIPVVLFGRTGAIEAAWIILSYCSAAAPILEITHYDSEKSLEFTEKALKKIKPAEQHITVYRQALKLFLEKLRKQTDTDGNRFAGYAPVLEAVAKRVAKEDNPRKFINDLQSTESIPQTLQSITTAILEREHDKLKLSGLQFEDANLTNILYSPEEQLDHLSVKLYGVPAPQLPQMTPKDMETYKSALTNWLEEHPFLDGGTETASRVFEAVICVHALMKQEISKSVFQEHLSQGAPVNPFLFEFYLNKTEQPPLEHIGLLYLSARATLSLNDKARLTAEVLDDDVPAGTEIVDVEIEIQRDDQPPQSKNFSVKLSGVIYLGQEVEDVHIDIPHGGTIEIGSGKQITLIAPVIIACENLKLNGHSLLIRDSDSLAIDRTSNTPPLAVHLEAANFNEPTVFASPIVRGKAVLEVNWPGADNYPWVNYLVKPSPPTGDPQIDEALRRLRNFVLSFRSHRRGGLARYAPKIQHLRMTKGMGRVVLASMLDHRILTLEGEHYFLHSDRLVEVTGLFFETCSNQQFPQKALDFTKTLIGQQTEKTTD